MDVRRLFGLFDLDCFDCLLLFQSRVCLARIAGGMRNRPKKDSCCVYHQAYHLCLSANKIFISGAEIDFELRYKTYPKLLIFASLVFIILSYLKRER